jgi:hypothetical protein
MRTLAALICILILPATTAAAGGEVVIQGDIYPLHIIPTFDHGYLAAYENGGIAVYAPDGSPAMRIAAPVGANIVNADIDRDGSVAAAINWHSPHTGGISIFRPDGSPAGQIDTGLYQPSQVCFAPDHSIWTLGNEDLRPTSDRADNFLLQHYSHGGELLGQFFPRSSFPADINPGQVILGLWGLRIANGRIGAALSRAGESKRGLWLEADLTGNELGRWTMPPSGGPAAMTDSGAVYIQGPGILRLDRTSGSWKTVPRSSNDILMGAEGNTLVFAVRGTSRIRREVQP